MANASGGGNGWLFQASAGLYIFFDEIKNIKSIKIEGSKEDIEVSYNDGATLYCQVKSTLLIGDRNNIGKHFSNALDSIKENSGADFYRYIFNFPNPLSTNENNFYLNEGLWSYYELPPKDKKKLDTEFRDHDLKDKFSMQRIYFYGSGMTRYSLIKKKIEDFCSRASIQTSLSNEIFERYRCRFENDISDRSIRKTKHQWIVPLITCCLKNDIDYNEVSSFISFGIFKNVRQNYLDFICDKIDDYEFFVKHLSDYNQFLESNLATENSHIAFITQNWSLYTDDFSSVEDQMVKEGVIKLYLFLLIRNQYTIDKIKEEASL